MTLDKVRTGTGRRFRTEGLQETALPIPYDAAAMPGATVLGTDGQIYQSTKVDGVYSWDRLINAERVVIGSNRTNYTIDLAGGGLQYKPAIQIEGVIGETSTIAITRTSPDADSCRLILAKSRSSSLGGDAALVSADTLGIILFSASDGTNVIGNARISARVLGTPAGNVTPAEILFATRQVGDTTLPVRMRISPEGNILINNTTGTEKLDVTGNIKASGNLVSTGLRTRNQVISTVPRDPISIQLGEFQRTPTSQVQGETRDTTAFMVYSAGEITPLLATTRTRGTLSTPLATTVGDAVGGWNSYSFDGTEYTVSASLQAVAGDTTTGSSPGEWRFQTTPSGSTSTSIRMAITASGNILINNTTGTERLSVTGNIQLTEATDSYKVGTNNVVGSRKTGWAVPVGAATRTTFATSSVTTEQLAERVKALIDDLTSHGLIGT